MGRPPSFYDIVSPIPMFDSTLPALRSGDVFRIVESDSIQPFNSLKPPIFERACSTYGYREDVFPVRGRMYIVKCVHDIHFDNKNGTFHYIVYECAPLHRPCMMCTWVLRNDGVVLNLESFTYRGIVRRAWLFSKK
jgi:hypothetical protein